LATSTLAANDFSFGPSYARVSAQVFKLLLLVSMSVCFVTLLLCPICCILAYASLSTF